MADHGVSDYESDIDSDVAVSDSDSDQDVDDGAPVNRGPWFNVVDPANFFLEDPSFVEETGPVNFGANTSILNYYLKFLEVVDASIVDLLVTETNRYAEQSIAAKTRPPRVLPRYARCRNWTPVSRQEMLAFIGLVLTMGVVKKPSYESYWENNARTWSMETPSFSQVMSRNRFQAILQFLHCNDNSTAIPHDQPGYDPLHKISPVINILNEAFERNYRLHQNVCVDERMVGFKGRHQLKQYLSNKKAHKWGIKLWVLADSTTGYTHHINVYKGRRNEHRSPNGQVLRISSGNGFNDLNKDHHVTIDSFFTSPKLVHDLKDNGTFCTGTVIKSRKGMPQSFRNARLPKGEMIVKSQGPVMAVLWSDRRLVTVLTSTGDSSKVDTTNSRGTAISIPTGIQRYNYTMGGVDVGDQMIQPFEPQFKSLKMWRKMLFNFFATAAVNAYICYRDSFVVQPKLDHLKFHQQLCQELIGDYREGSKNQQLRTVRLEHRNISRISERHFPEKIPEGKRKKCVVCSSGHEGFKKSRIQWWCPECKVGLCVERCFRRYHTRVNYEE